MSCCGLDHGLVPVVLRLIEARGASTDLLRDAQERGLALATAVSDSHDPAMAPALDRYVRDALRQIYQDGHRSGREWDAAALAVGALELGCTLVHFQESSTPPVASIDTACPELELPATDDVPTEAFVVGWSCDPSLANDAPGGVQSPTVTPRGAPGQTGQFLALKSGYEVKLEHVRDARSDFYVATIHRLENDVHRFWGAVGASKDEALAAASTLIDELLALREEQGAKTSAPAKDGRSHVA